jgi:RNA polymerase sigma-70 factor (ECF subfamily)
MYVSDDQVGEKPMSYDTDNRAGGEPRFERFYKEHLLDISGYVRRRVTSWEASDVTAQVFAVAWRRFEQIPPPPTDRLWLFGVARRTIADHRRSGIRRLRLHKRLVEQAQPFAAGDDLDPVHARVELAMARLRPKDREVLRLVFWDGLTYAEAAVVLGCSPNAVEVRFRRAQGRVRSALSIVPASGEAADANTVPIRQWRTQP